MGTGIDRKEVEDRIALIKAKAKIKEESKKIEEQKRKRGRPSNADKIKEIENDPNWELIGTRTETPVGEFIFEIKWSWEKKVAYGCRLCEQKEIGLSDDYYTKEGVAEHIVSYHKNNEDDGSSAAYLYPRHKVKEK